MKFGNAYSFIVSFIIIVLCNAVEEELKRTCHVIENGILPFMKMDKGEICTVGTEIKTEKECSEALNFASDLGIKISSEALTKVTVGSWGFLPYQCSYRAGGDQTFFFNHRKTTNAKLFVNGMHNVICKNGCMMKELPNADDQSNVSKENSEPVLLNNTSKAKVEVLFFNRATKVGSLAILKLMDVYLKKNNGFNVRVDAQDRTLDGRLSKEEQMWQSNMFKYLNPPTAYVRHTRFTDFRRFNHSMPIYINLVRDPVEKAISFYYYIRSSPYIVNVKQRISPDWPLPDLEWLQKDYEECVALKDPECQYIEGERTPDTMYQLTDFFCGHDSHCDGFNTERVMREAMQNVERHYAVVGVIEQLNKTLTVLEHYIPRFFKGALDTYYKARWLRKVNRNNMKPHVSEETKQIVRRNFTREIEFYEFCKQRLHNQYIAIQKDTNLPV